MICVKEKKSKNRSDLRAVSMLGGDTFIQHQHN